VSATSSGGSAGSGLGAPDSERAAARFGRDRYKWIALSNTTLATLIAMIDASIVLIALPDIFRGIRINPLQPGNTIYLLGIVMGFLIVTSVMVVSLGRLGDIYGRVRIYNLGFLVFTVFSIPLCITWMYGPAAAIWLIVFRIFQALGAAMLLANSAAILTDAFPDNQRGLALGINNISGIVGTTIGLVVGGLLAPISWRLVFLVSVPIGIVGTVWAYRSLRELGERRAARIDWAGNLAFAAGLILVLLGIATGIQPWNHHDMGWSSPRVIAELALGLILLAIFAVIELRAEDPMFDLRLFRIRAFLAGNIASLLGSIGRGGLQFMLVIWLQGIWLPLHGYSLVKTPMWAGIAMLPLIGGFLLSGPVSGILSDRFGPRRFAVTGPLLGALSMALLSTLPVDFNYVEFALLLFLFGIGNGMFAAPNRANVMNSVPPWRRGVASGMSATFQNSGQVLSIGIYFSLMVIGLAAKLPHALDSGLLAHGVPASTAYAISHVSPVATLFGALLGANVVTAHMPPHVLHALTPAARAAITARSFFPRLITPAFEGALSDALRFSVIAFLITAAASWLRGSTQRWEEPAASVAPALPATPGALVSR
jgi:MFS family permease